MHGFVQGWSELGLAMKHGAEVPAAAHHGAAVLQDFLGPAHAVLPAAGYGLFGDQLGETATQRIAALTKVQKKVLPVRDVVEVEKVVVTDGAKSEL